MSPLALAIALATNEEPLNPGHSWFLAVSCLEFKNRVFAGMPETGRTDSRLVAAVRNLGLPKHHVLWLQDKDADTRRIDYEFRETIGRAKKDDTVFVYYTGHGYRDRQSMLFATWNAEVGFPGWRLSRIFDQIGRSFHGRAVVFFADCCDSGKLVDYAEKSKKKVAVLCSAGSHQDVPEGWTFTTSLARVFEGRSEIDTDQNGMIDWDEAVAYVQGQVRTEYGHPGASFKPPGFELSWPTGH